MIRLILADDQAIIREGLRSLLSLQPDLEVVSEAENGQQATQQVAELLPDVVLMDIRMPVMDGVAATRQICQAHPNTRVLVLTTFDDDEYVYRAMQYGARGYLLKHTRLAELAQAIQAVHQGATYLGPGLFAKAITHLTPTLTDVIPSELLALTPREQEVLYLITTGANNREIAQHLQISERTVKNHVTGILSQLNLRDRTQAAMFASPFSDQLRPASDQTA
jgi:DNA-binding NarL/FixJ family response regulator